MATWGQPPPAVQRSETPWARFILITGNDHPEIYRKFICPQYSCNMPSAIFNTVTCSSNRESLRTVSGGSGLSFLFVPTTVWDRVSDPVRPSRARAACLLLHLHALPERHVSLDLLRCRLEARDRTRQHPDCACRQPRHRNNSPCPSTGTPCGVALGLKCSVLIASGGKYWLPSTSTHWFDSASTVPSQIAFAIRPV